jgi:hypothetical protein
MKPAQTAAWRHLRLIIGLVGLGAAWLWRHHRAGAFVYHSVSNADNDAAESEELRN